MKRTFTISAIIITAMLLFACGGDSTSDGGASEGIGSIGGRVTINGMSDVSNCVITAELNSGGKTASVNRSISLGDVPSKSTTSGDGVYVTLTDSEGNYILTGLPEGTYTVTAEKASTLGAVMPNILVDPVRSSSTVTLDIVLTATGSVSGTATLIDNPVAYGTFIYAAGTSYVAAADADGSFTISNIPIGTYTIVYYHSDYVTQTEESVVVNAAADTPLSPVILERETQSTKPFVVYTNPTANEVDVKRDTAVNIVFNTEMNEATINSDNIKVKDAANNTVSGTLSYSDSVALFVPNVVLDRSVKYTVTVSPLVENIVGTTMGYEHRAYFTTDNTIWNFTVTFNKNDDDAEGTMDPQVITEGTLANLNTCGFTKTSWVFTGWSTTPGGEVEYADEAEYAMGTGSVVLYAKWVEDPFLSATTPGEQVTVTAGGVEFKMVYANNQASITFPFSPNSGTPVDTAKETITHKFFMGETQVNWAVWKAVYDWAVHDDRGANKYTFQNPGRMGSVDGGAGMTNQHPVTMVSWRDAVIWCNALSEMTGAEAVYIHKDTGVVLRSSATDAYGAGIDVEDVVKSEDDNLTRKGYRLPTSKEWEYTARYIGTVAPTVESLASEYIARNIRGGNADLTEGYYWTPAAYASGATADYNNADATKAVAWYDQNTGPGDGSGTPRTSRPVGLKAENALDLYDMSGNVWEWCFTASGSARVLRGGSWIYPAYSLQVGHWGSVSPDDRLASVGFRFARTQ